MDALRFNANKDLAPSLYFGVSNSLMISDFSSLTDFVYNYWKYVDPSKHHWGEVMGNFLWLSDYDESRSDDFDFYDLHFNWKYAGVIIFALDNFPSSVPLCIVPTIEGLEKKVS